MASYTAEPFFEPDGVELDIAFGEPQRQSRVTILFRRLLAIPHDIVMFVLVLVAIPLLIVGWVSALFLGRLPRWIARYVMGVIAYAIRVNAYQYLLADKFPPFGFSAPDYSVAVSIGASRLSRLKVFFRRLLSIPADIVVFIALIGFGLLSPIIWLVTLVRGRMPQIFFSVSAAVIRYEARWFAYVWLLTDKYPRGLFGDDASDWVPEWASAEEQQRRRNLRLTLSQGAKRLMVLIIVLGIVGFIAIIVLDVKVISGELNLVAAENRLELASRDYVDSVRTCQSGPAALSCVERQDAAWGQAFDRFGKDIHNISFADSSGKSALVHDARNVGAALVAASEAKTVAAHTTAINRVGRVLATFEKDAKSLLGHEL